MKSPFQIWLLYAVCLALAIPALAWVSWQAISVERAREADRQQTELARREAELQERISSALWRMDSFLSPLIAQEAARPYYLYEPFLRYPQPAPEQRQAGDEANSPSQTAETGSAPTGVLPSPLLLAPSRLVLLHFQLSSNNEFSSPQNPVGPDFDHAVVACGLSADQLANNGTRLEELKSRVTYDQLIAQCPPEDRPEDRFPESVEPSSHSSGVEDETGSNSIVGNSIQNLPPSQKADLGEWLDAAGTPGGQTGIPAQESKQQAQRYRNVDRGNREFDQRSKSLDNFAKSAWHENQLFQGYMASDADPVVTVGIMRPFWIGDCLLLARRVEAPRETQIQGCWLDWNEIRDRLGSEIHDLLPEFEITPIDEVHQLRIGQALATLPVQLQMDRDRAAAMLQLPGGETPLAKSGIQRALWFAWGSLASVAIAGALLLNGLIVLSQRRGAFVSAVTHELRTPLTTFRMYAEMLAERMVPSPEKQQQYAETMRIEADRLSHLVENVLQFARLERTRPASRREPTSWARLRDRFESRLEQRASQCGMQLEWEMDGPVREKEFHSDPAALEQILFNLVDNACKYARHASDRRIVVSVRFVDREMNVSVRDFGPGVAAAERKRMFRPFCKSDQSSAETAQGVGLGLALCQKMAATLRGTLTAENAAPGLLVTLRFPVETRAA